MIGAFMDMKFVRQTDDITESPKDLFVERLSNGNAYT